MYELKLRS